MPFPKALARSETQTVSSSIWTPAVDYISHDTNRHAKSAIKLYVCMCTHACMCVYVFVCLWAPFGVIYCFDIINSTLLNTIVSQWSVAKWLISWYKKIYMRINFIFRLASLMDCTINLRFLCLNYMYNTCIRRSWCSLSKSNTCLPLCSGNSFDATGTKLHCYLSFLWTTSAASRRETSSDPRSRENSECHSYQAKKETWLSR